VAHGALPKLKKDAIFHVVKDQFRHREAPFVHPRYFTFYATSKPCGLPAEKPTMQHKIRFAPRCAMHYNTRTPLSRVVFMIPRTDTLQLIGPADAGRKISREEFSTVDFQEPFKYERVRGRLVVMPPPGHAHRQASRPFRRELGLYWGLHPEIVDDVDVEGWVATSDDDDRIPDICVYLAGQQSGERVPDRIPDLVFEFVSKSRRDQERDYIFKRAEYYEIGVKEYVIVDRFKQSVLVLAWQADDYAERVLAADVEYTSLLLPGLKVSLREVFAE
jgi:Uma2 family endonuclease